MRRRVRQRALDHAALASRRALCVQARLDRDLRGKHPRAFVGPALKARCVPAPALRATHGRMSHVRGEATTINANRDLASLEIVRAMLLILEQSVHVSALQLTVLSLVRPPRLRAAADRSRSCARASP